MSDKNNKNDEIGLILDVKFVAELLKYLPDKLMIYNLQENYLTY